MYFCCLKLKSDVIYLQDKALKRQLCCAALLVHMMEI